MANAKEIQNRIRSIQDTMKITRAMYMMSSMKLRKAKQQLENTEPYFFGLQDQISSILYHFLIWSTYILITAVLIMRRASRKSIYSTHRR